VASGIRADGLRRLAGLKQVSAGAPGLAAPATSLTLPSYSEEFAYGCGNLHTRV